MTRLSSSTRRLRLPFTGQMLLLQVGVVALAVGVTFGLIAWLFERELTAQYEQRALTVARVVAADPVVVDAVAHNDPQHVLSARAERIRRASGALFVVLADRRGIRLTHPKLTHPKPVLIGKPMSTDATDVLAGREVTTVETGTLGLSARGKAPVRNAQGKVVGLVSVGFDSGGIGRHIKGSLLPALQAAVAVLMLGIAASAAFARRLGRLTLGLEPHQMAELIREREAVLRGVGEGVLAVDAAGRVSVCNEEASRMLHVTAAVGTAVAELNLPARLAAILGTKQPVSNLVTIVGLGLALARHAARSLGGRVEVASAGGDRHGAIFVALLPDVVEYDAPLVTPAAATAPAGDWATTGPSR